MAHYTVHTPIQGDPRFESSYLDQGLEPIEARYASMVEGMDKSLGDLLDYLDANGLTENTVIFFMSDNGGLSAVARGGERHSHNWPLSSGKGSLREGGIREPMLVRWPGVTPEGSSSNTPVIIEDFFPTLLDMSGIKAYSPIQKVDGKSFVPLLKGEKSEGERALFWHYPNHWGPSGPGIAAASVVRKGDWKLIYYHTSGAFELFDLSKDISEQYNLADTSPEKRKELAVVLGNYLREVNAQMPRFSKNGALVPWPDLVKEP
jgi:arylsulfatase A-like enzyme